VKYVQPYGISDPNASYINGDPSIARQGSIPPAAAFENPMRELVHIITDSNLVPSDTDLEQCAKGMRSQFMNYCIDTGSVNTLSVALSPPIGAYTFGLPLRVRVANTNTGSTTIDAGAGRVPVKKPNGSELQAGDLPAFGLAELVYDGTVFQMINFTGAAPSGPPQTFLYNIPYCVDSSTTRNLVIANFSPAITSLAAGTIFMVKIANTSNGITANINVNGLGNKPIFAQGCNTNWPLLPGDMQVGDVLVFTYDGTRFWVYANNAINESVTVNVSTVAQIKDLFSALGRKRISTSGSLTILLATGVYSGLTTTGLYGTNVILTYHPEADRITLQGTMKSGQVPPPNGGVFQRSGPDPASIANDSAYNIQMLRARYGTEIRVDGTSGACGIKHIGPGAINLTNLLVTGPNYTVTGQAGFAAEGSMTCTGCSAWGLGDVGFGVYMNASFNAYNCHSCGNMTRGFGITGGNAYFAGGSASGNATNGLEVTGGGTAGTQASDFVSLSAGFQTVCNGSCGVSAQTGYALLAYATAVSNGVLDCYAFNAGTIGSLYSSIGSVSPDWNSEGNLNSIAVWYI